LLNGQDSPDSGAAIRLGDKHSGVTRSGLMLVWFMRTTAALWIMQGLVQWHVVLTTPDTLFDKLPASASVAIVFFAVMDMLAAVGLWLATPWGGVLWLLVALSQIVVALVMPDFFDGGRFVIALDVLLIGLYLFLTYEAGREPERRMSARRAATRIWRGAALGHWPASWRFWESFRR